MIKMRCNKTFQLFDTVGLASAPCDANGIVNSTNTFIRSETICSITFLVMRHHWCWCQCHMLLSVSSVAPFHLLGQNNQKDVQHDFGHVMPLALVTALHAANCVENDTIAFVWSRRSKWKTKWLLFMWCHWCKHQHHVTLMLSTMAPSHFLGQDNQNEVQYDFFGYLMPLALESDDANAIVNSTTAILRSRQSKWGATWLFFINN